MTNLFFVFFCLFFIYCENAFYNAGIVSFPDIPNTYETYVEYIEKGKGMDIIIFPEMTILAYPEEMVIGANPGTNSSAELHQPILHALSKAAKENNIYVVLVMMEKGISCKRGETPRCEFDFLIHNTMVVLDREGTIVTKYRKKHVVLDYEWLFTPGDGSPVFFDADFGVRFGLMICFDILFSTPGTPEVYEGNITDMLYSSGFPDREPFITVLQYHQGWSDFYNVGFLGSNKGPSSCFSRGELINFWNNKEQGMITCKMPILPHHDPNVPFEAVPAQKQQQPEEKEKIILPIIPQKEGEDLWQQNKTFIRIEDIGMSQTLELDIDALNCKISFNISSVPSSSPKEYYLFAAYRENMDLLTIPWKATTYYCGFINCGTTTENCNPVSLKAMTNFQTNTYFESFDIELTLKEEYRMVVNSVATNEQSPLQNGQFTWEHNKMNHKIQSTKDLKEPILFAGIIGEYDDEYTPPK